MDFWETLNRKLEIDRLKKDKKHQEWLNTLDGKIHTAYNNFKFWCRCNGYNPYINTYLLLQKYLYNTDIKFKNEDRKLFLKETTNYINNKNKLLELIIADGCLGD